MQARHRNRTLYFHELAQTSRKYFIPYIGQFFASKTTKVERKQLGRESRILEIGCGDGGNLLPFAQMGCYTLGVDIADGRIADARRFFAECGAKGDFIASDVFLLEERLRVGGQGPGILRGSFDIIICHDVIEHIGDKHRFLSLLPQFLASDGIIFMSFPAWQMPFGGHQQICRSRLVSHLPFIHLLPTALYRWLLRASGKDEDEACIKELMSIKETRTPIELFERTLKSIGTLTIADRTLWFINPHYEAKFGLHPRRLPTWLSAIPHVRNYFTTSCFYVLAGRSFLTRSWSDFGAPCQNFGTNA